MDTTLTIRPVQGWNWLQLKADGEPSLA